MNRRSFMAFCLALAGCATTEPGPQSVLIDARAAGQSVQGAKCTVQTVARTFDVETPATIELDRNDGGLTIVCVKPGYRTAELQYRSESSSGSGMGLQVGGGSGGVGVGLSFPIGRRLPQPYPSQLIVDMTREQ